MAKLLSDALVIFGMTGDLAHKMIFPALYAMVKKGALKAPVTRDYETGPHGYYNREGYWVDELLAV